MRESTHNKPFARESFEAGIFQNNQLILHNDEVHSFEFVMESLMEVCDHSEIQAEQCTMIAHYKGQCDVKRGKRDSLKPMQLGLIRKGLKATIE